MEVLPTLAVTVSVIVALGVAYVVHRSEEVSGANSPRDIPRDQSVGAAGFGDGGGFGGDGGGSC